jgi:hypothetical protein
MFNKVIGTTAQMSPLALDSDEKKITMKKPFKDTTDLTDAFGNWIAQIKSDV